MRLDALFGLAAIVGAEAFSSWPVYFMKSASLRPCARRRYSKSRIMESIWRSIIASGISTVAFSMTFSITALVKAFWSRSAA